MPVCPPTVCVLPSTLALLTPSSIIRSLFAHAVPQTEKHLPYPSDTADSQLLSYKTALDVYTDLHASFSTVLLDAACASCCVDRPLSPSPPPDPPKGHGAKSCRMSTCHTPPQTTSSLRTRTLSPHSCIVLVSPGQSTLDSVNITLWQNSEVLTHLTAWETQRLLNKSLS